MVEISLSGSGEGPGWVTAPGYSTAAFSEPPILGVLTSRPEGARSGILPGPLYVAPVMAPALCEAGDCMKIDAVFWTSHGSVFIP
jgi:hypothetical protein